MHDRSETRDYRWTFLARDRPDPAASNTPSLLIRFFLRTYGYFRLILDILLTFPFLILYHYTFGPLLPWMTLSAYLVTRYIKLVGTHLRMHLPKNDPEEWIVPKVPYKRMIEGREGEVVEVVKLPPIPDDYRQGVAICREVESVERPGFLLSPPTAKGKGQESAKEGEKIVLYFVGGAYTVGHPCQYPFAWQMSKALKCRVLGVNHRKVLNRSQAFPAPLLDAMAGYLYLTQELNFNARNIILMGDSAGGNLSLCLSRYLSELSPRLPQPAFMALSSPWCDWTSSFPSKVYNARYDYLSSKGGSLSITSALRHYKPEIKLDPYVSAALARPGECSYLKQEGVKVYIQLGTREMLADEDRSLYQAMRGDGVDVRLSEVEDGLHDDAVAQWPGSRSWPIWRNDVKQLVGIFESTGDDSANQVDVTGTQIANPLGP